MQCERCLEQLDSYLDGELDAQTAKSLEAHLSRCQVCMDERRVAERERRLYRALSAATDVPAGLWSRVATGIAAVEARERRRAAVRPWSPLWLMSWRALGLATACAALAVGLWAVWRPAARAPPVARQAPSSAGALTAAPPVSRSPLVSENAAPSDAVILAPPRTRAVAAPTRAAPTSRPTPDAERLLRQTEQAYLAAIERLQAQAAARQSPLEPAALHFLAAAYRKKVEALSEIVLMTEPLNN